MLNSAQARIAPVSPVTTDEQFIATVIAALDGRENGTAASDALLSRAAFRVYRNTVRLGALDALQANYRTVAQLIGDEWFAAAAHRYLDEQPPASACLLDYGADFAGFIARLDDAAELPYLPAVASLDRAWTEAHCAVDAPPLTLDAVHDLATNGASIFQHPAATAFWFADTPAAALWCASRSGIDDLSSIDWRGGGALLTRPQAGVVWAACDEATVVLFVAFAGGAAIAEALNQAAGRFGAVTAGRSFHQLVAQGALTASPVGESS